MFQLSIGTLLTLSSLYSDKFNDKTDSYINNDGISINSAYEEQLSYQLSGIFPVSVSKSNKPSSINLFIITPSSWTYE